MAIQNFRLVDMNVWPLYLREWTSGAFDLSVAACAIKEFGPGCINKNSAPLAGTMILFSVLLEVGAHVPGVCHMIPGQPC